MTAGHRVLPPLPLEHGTGHGPTELVFVNFLELLLSLRALSTWRTVAEERETVRHIGPEHVPHMSSS